MREKVFGSDFSSSSISDSNHTATHSADVRAQLSFYLNMDADCVCVRVRAHLPGTVISTNLPAQTFSSLRRLLSSLWFMTLIKTPTCVSISVCVRAHCPLPSLHGLRSQPAPPPVADNSRGCGCDCFPSVLVTLATFIEGGSSPPVCSRRISCLTRPRGALRQSRTTAA